MAQTRAQVLYRTLCRVIHDPAIIGKLGDNPDELASPLRELIRQEHLDAAYHFRQQGQYYQALCQYLLSIWQGELSRKALLGICKLLPHKMHRALRPVRT
jgi:hypothetical protein